MPRIMTAIVTLTLPVPMKATIRAIRASSGIGTTRIADRDGEKLAGAAVAQVEADRQRDRRCQRQRHEADRQLGGHQIPDLAQSADLQPRPLDGVALVEDEVDGPAERAEKAGRSQG